MPDKIIYLVVSEPGGIDGRDFTDKGGRIKFASFDRSSAEAKLDAWHKLKLKAVSEEELDKIKNLAFEKLDKVEQLVLGVNQTQYRKVNLYAPIRLNSGTEVFYTDVDGWLDSDLGDEYEEFLEKLRERRKINSTP